MKIAIVTGSILLALAGRASAQPGMEPAGRSAPPPAPNQPGELKSEETALLLSLGGTVASWGLMLGASQVTDDPEAYSALATAGAIGMMFAPSVGHWYAGKFATRGMGLRALAAVTGLVGLAVALDQCPLFSSEPCDGMTGAILILGSAGLFVGGTIDDIVTAPRRVRRLNRERGGVAIAPTVTHHSAGLALGGRF